MNQAITIRKSWIGLFLIALTGSLAITVIIGTVYVLAHQHQLTQQTYVLLAPLLSLPSSARLSACTSMNSALCT